MNKAVEVVKAKEDLDTAFFLFEFRNPRPYWQCVYHCQQAVEKYLKVFLIDSVPDINVKKLGHDFDTLYYQSVQLNEKFGKFEDFCLDLGGYGSGLRYDNQYEFNDVIVEKLLEKAVEFEGFIRSELNHIPINREVEAIDPERKKFIFSQLDSGLPLKAVREFFGLSDRQFKQLLNEWDELPTSENQ